MARTYFRRIEEKRQGCAAGADEVGRGSFAGPLVVGVVIYSRALTKIKGLNDSKKIPLNKRKSLARKIYKSCSCSVGLLWPSELDELGLTKGTELALGRAFACLGQQVDFLMMDGKYPFNVAGAECECFIKGDSKLRSIAAASIIAKVFRDELMAKYESVFNDFDWASHVGYGTKKHRANILAHGATRIHRKTFLTKLMSSHAN